MSYFFLYEDWTKSFLHWCKEMFVATLGSVSMSERTGFRGWGWRVKMDVDMVVQTPRTLYPIPCALYPVLHTLYRKSYTLNLKPKAFNP